MLQTSVRQLCEFAARIGSLDHRYSPSPSAREGILGHQWLQSQYPDHEAEHPIEGVYESVSSSPPTPLTLKGRADLYRAPQEGQLAQLIEIKTFRGSPDRINPGQQHQHWAQLKVYGALICKRDGLEQVHLSLVYLDVDSKARHEQEDILSAEELWQALQELADEWIQWQLKETAHRHERDGYLKQLAFLEQGFRSGQKPLSETVYKAISLQAPLLLEAPTGLGKTLGVIFPALKAMPEKQLDRLFFLTARTTGRQLALDNLKKLFGRDGTPPIRSLELIAREKSCEYPENACHGESCPLADGFFDRLPKAREQAADAHWLDTDAIKDIARQHTLCPYFLMQEMARWSDIVVGDVNHYFDDGAILHSHTVEEGWRSVVLVDEAHNLIDRARGMYSTILEQRRFEEPAQKAGGKHGLKAAFASVQKGWQQLEDLIFPDCQALFGTDEENKEDNGIISRFSDELPDTLVQPISQLSSALAKSLADKPEDQLLQQALFDCLGFLRLAERYGPHSVVEITREEHDSGELWATSHLTLTIHNLIPADFLKPKFEDSAASILFSATLQPSVYYRDMLGMPENTRDVQTSGPFNKQQMTLGFPAIDTRYNRREQNHLKLATTLLNNYRQRPGNHLIFFSSFSYLHTIAKAVASLDSDVNILKQKPTMSEAQRQSFIQTFRRKRNLMGFAVLGGVFSEGIDLPGDELNAVTVITLGLPPSDRLHKILEERIKQRFGDEHGYNYTWLYPGMRKVVQAAGRLIRTPEDTGWIDLIDPRYSRPEVRALLPDWWFSE